MSSGGSNWGCPHEVDGKCLHVESRPCDPGMKGCVLSGRFLFSNPEKNRRSKTRKLKKNQKTGKKTSQG